MTAPRRGDRRRARVRTQALVGAWLVFVWLALYGRVTVADVCGGIVAATVVLVCFPVPATSARHTFRPLAAAKLAVTFARMVVIANLAVAAAVLAPARRVRPGIIDFPMFYDDDLVVTVIANAITLTPGTITVDAASDPAVLSVHCLSLDADEVRADIRRLEELAIATFAPDDVVAAYRSTTEDGSNNSRTEES